MTWEETIVYIRTLPEYKDLVEKAYFEEDLSLNSERFKNSPEFRETIKIIHKYKKEGRSVLDIGSGNGITAVAFALNGYEVTAVEPDPSETVGAGAIRKLITHYALKNVTVFESFAEDIGFKDETFDIVYIRQAMHHANDLKKFIQECSRVLKKGGLLLTIRDHVIFNDEDREEFLKVHPLQKFYGGENAYSEKEYISAMEGSGMEIKKVLRTFDSEINYFPMDPVAVEHNKRKKTLALFVLKLIPFLVPEKLKKKIGNVLNEKDYPGRMYSFIAIKK
jgi:ubiquinone/menaquinone biosynthesis C-methylase UbiE